MQCLIQYLNRPVFRILCGTLVALVLGLWGTLRLLPAPPLLADVPFSGLVLDRTGQLLRMGLTSDEKFRAFTPLSQISPQAVRAVLLYEDRHFYRHPGVNPLALIRAGAAMLFGGRRMGGSTITMQVARLRYTLNTTTISGKIVQMWQALRLERHYTKQEILEAYFSLAPYGGNIEGIGAASRVYFRCAPDRLRLSESLALAVVPQNPVRRSPLRGPDFDPARARLSAMWQDEYGSAGGNATDNARSDAPPLRLFSLAELPFEAPHVSAALLLQPNPDHAAFRTTLDLSLQRLLETRLSAFAARGRLYGLTNAAALILHWPSMEIRALTGSADFHNAGIAGQVDGTLARRSPGSTLKPFIYALAADQGLIHPQTLLFDSPRSFGGYDPENFDRTFKGPLPAHEALRLSRNIPAIQLASRLSPDLYSFLRRAGVALPQGPTHYGLSLVLGGAEVSMRELADLYAILPNKGVYRPARLLSSPAASSTPAGESPAVPLLSPEAAIMTLHMLEEPGRGVRTGRGSLPLRYKTGTSNGFRDAWTVGIIGPYVLVVWVGNFDNASNALLIGGEVAAPLFEDTARALTLHEPLKDMIPGLPAVRDAGLNLIRIPVCTDTGDTDTRLCPRQTETWYIPGRSPTASSGVYRNILIDTRTELRACRASAFTREVVWEFWPTDLQAMFVRAGVTKPSPPPFGPECVDAADNNGSGGNPPRILTPREGVVYQRRVGDELSGRNAIPLTAGVDPDADTVFWFVNERFLGRSLPDAPLTWQPENGTHTVRAVDNLGRASSLRVRVETLP